jgi:hypothetical protein
MTKKKFSVALAIMIYLILIPISMAFYYDYTVFKKGHVVSVTVLGTDGSDLDFVMNGHTFSKKLNKYAFDSFKKGDTIQLKYLEGYEHHFLFQNENPLNVGPLLIAMFFFGASYVIYYYCIKKEEGK